ncbi:MAG TPA: hypothetical protein DER02_05350 [Gammaproteobacteria bacterium]|nr:hypothetical protein [Gammaproteobacteria bacterium]|tara:strand:- start:5751 stop:6023 length:273 start_codon:yes stop_codon:yes gene_type:complete
MDKRDASVAIEFPCRYPIKVIGVDEPDFVDRVLRIIRQHAPDLASQDVRTRSSRGERFVAVSVILTAQGEQQLRAINDNLLADANVRMVF